jgi:hypothetical protein
MDRIVFAAVLLLAYLAAHFFIRYDNKKIEAECTFKKPSNPTDKA